MKITFDDEEKYLVKTSKYLILPSIYGFYHNIHYMPVFGLLGSFISYQFWRKPTLGFRRNLDLIYQPILGTYFFIKGSFYSQNYYATILGNTSLIISLFYFHQSHEYYKQKNRLWYVKHIIFHSCMIFSSLMAYKSQLKN